MKILEKEDPVLYQCEECGFRYKEKELALKCEAWCRKHQGCNLEIVRYAVESAAQDENGKINL
ncbi:MAG TPA: hypothetical protein VJA63_01605 [Candidatus Paceibacterota bacterium]